MIDFCGHYNRLMAIASLARDQGLTANYEALKSAADDMLRLREVEHHARTVMTLLDDGGPAQWGAHLIDNDDNPGQRLRDALGGFT